VFFAFRSSTFTIHVATKHNLSSLVSKAFSAKMKDDEVGS